MNKKSKLLLVGLITLSTLTIHYYDIILAGVFGQSHFMHAIHGRLCYIPIVLAAFWFGLRGGLIVATIISAFSLLYIQIGPVGMAHELYGEFAEIAFYFAIGGFAGILLDSERASRNRREEAERKLEQAERLSLMGQIVTSIAHEIKNPLGSIKGAVQILKDKATPEHDKNEFATIIEKEVDRLDKVVRDYLTFSKPGPTTIVDTDLKEVIEIVIKQMKYQCDEKNITLDFQSWGPHIISGDKDKLHQLCLNLLLNSLQAMPNGGRIDIGLHDITEITGKWLELKISDSGQGIAPDAMDKIFEPFYSTKSQGTGLGLATAKTIVADHGGKIRVTSEPGRGTAFYIIFPLKSTGQNR
jgi:two-component system, NtrC family, sensor histidine kinase HydH